MSLELVIKELPVSIPQAIENLEELKAQLAPMLERYKGLIVSEDGIKEAKNDRASLNKLKDAVDNRRKDIKKQVSAIVEPLEKQCKEITAMIDEPIQAIDVQIKAYEEKEKLDKLTALKTAFYSMDKPEWLDFNSVCPAKWQNKTEKTDKLTEQIQSAIDSINASLAEIKDIYGQSQFYLAIIDKYKQTLDKSQALSYAIVLEKQLAEKKAAEERTEAEKKAREEQAHAESVLNASTINANESNDSIPPTEQTAVKTQSESNERIVSGCFKVSGTPEQIKALASFMKSNGIKYEIVK